MKKEILSIHSNAPYLISVYGFGSYFRNHNANDCDLLLIVDENYPDLGKIHTELHQIFSNLGIKLSVLFDLTILTKREFNGNPPLLELTQLIELSKISHPYIN